MLTLSGLSRHSIANGVKNTAILEGSPKGTIELWLSITLGDEEMAQHRGDPFVFPSILLALQHGQDLRIKCPISDRLAINLPDILRIFSIMLRLPEIKVEVEETAHAHNAAASGVLTGLSCGVDSFQVMAANFIEPKFKSRTVTHLTFNDVGSHGTGQYHKVAKERLARAHKVASELGLPLFEVNSNFSEALDLDFQQTHTARNVSSAYMFAGHCGTFLYGTNGNRIESTGIYPSPDMAFADQVLLPLFSTDQMTCIGPDARLSRSEKTQQIAHIPIVQQNLDVCQMLVPAGDKINCSHCAKCMRTMVTLDCMGLLDKYEAVFDVKHYLANREWMMRSLVGSSKDVDQDTVALAVEHGLAQHWRTQLKLKAPWIQIGTRSLRRLRRTLVGGQQ